MYIVVIFLHWLLNVLYNGQDRRTHGWIYVDMEPEDQKTQRYTVNLRRRGHCYCRAEFWWWTVLQHVCGHFFLHQPPTAHIHQCTLAVLPSTWYRVGCRFSTPDGLPYECMCDLKCNFRHLIWLLTYFKLSIPSGWRWLSWKNQQFPIPRFYPRVSTVNKMTLQPWYVGYECFLRSLIPALISNDVPSKVWDEITYSFLNFNGATVEV